MEAVIVRLSIPLVDYSNVLDLTKVHNLPLKAKDGYSVKVDINAEYLVTDNSRNHFLELHKEDFADCSVYHTGSDRHFYCGLPPLLDATTTRSCVMQLYQGRSSSEWCQSKLIYGMCYFARYIFSKIVCTVFWEYLVILREFLQFNNFQKVPFVYQKFYMANFSNVSIKAIERGILLSIEDVKN